MSKDQQLEKFISLCYFGWQITVLHLENNEPHPRGQKAIDDFINWLSNRYRSPDPMDPIIKKLLEGAFKHSGVFAEIVLDEGGRLPIDLVAPPLNTLTLQKKGNIWRWGQWQNEKFVDMSSCLTVLYVPIYTFDDHEQPLTSPFEPATINRVRRVIEYVLTELINIALQAQGIQARPSFSLSEEAVLKSPKKLEQEKFSERVRKLSEAGWTDREMSEHLNVSEKTVYRIREKLGLINKRKKSD